MANVVTDFAKDVGNEMKNLAEKTKKETLGLFQEIKDECLQVDVVKEYSWNFISSIHTWFYMPFLPALHRPGWMLRYFVGPFDTEWLESFFADFWAGITVALTLIPQVCLFYSTHFRLFITMFIIRLCRTQNLPIFLPLTVCTRLFYHLLFIPSSEVPCSSEWVQWLWCPYSWVSWSFNTMSFLVVSTLSTWLESVPFVWVSFCPSCPF
jgi:hypothetical protein